MASGTPDDLGHIRAAFDPLGEARRAASTPAPPASAQSGRIYVTGATEYAAGGLKPRPPPHATKPLPLKSPHLLSTLLERQVVQVSCGWRHSALVLDDGSLFVCGENDKGQLGLPGAGDSNDVSDEPQPPPRSVPVPTLVPGLAATVRVTQVSCGRSHTCFVGSEGELFSFGLNLYGQLGLGSLVSESTPRRVSNLGGMAASVSCGDLHTLVLRSDGRALSCGFNDAGRLGRALEEAEATCAERLGALPLHAAVASQSDAFAVVAVAAGGAHSAVVCADGSVYTFGRGECGQLGHGAATPELSPRRITALKQHKIRRSALGAQHSLFLSSLGVPYACGCGGYGRLGLGDREAAFVPAVIGSLSEHIIVQISAGSSHSSFVTEFGKVLLCGDNGSGQLGLDSGKSTCLVPTVPPKFERDEGLARVAPLAPHSPAKKGKFLKKGEGKNLVQSMGRDAEERARDKEREEHERQIAEAALAHPHPIRVLGASCGGSHTAFLLRAVVDPKVDYREDQVALAATVIESFFRGNHVRAVNEAVERRKRTKEMKTHTMQQRHAAASVIQAAGRMHLAVLGRERMEQLAQMRELRDAADADGNNWGRAQGQFYAAQTGKAFSTPSVNITKASW